MKTLGQLLGSTARTEILRVLGRPIGAVGLRPLARWAGLHPHSAEMALRNLVEEGLVCRQEAGGRPLYRRSPDHPDWPVLEGIFAAADRGRVRQRSSGLQLRAGRILPFIEEANRMLSHARGQERVT